jgi:Bacterial pre-peptidase C-terminal domain
MRLRGAGARARLLLALLLLVGSFVAAPQAPGSVPASTARAKHQPATHRHDRDGAQQQRAANEASKRGDQRGRDHQPAHQPRAEGSARKDKVTKNNEDAKTGTSLRQQEAQDAALDAGVIAAANADDVVALDCGELITIQVGDRTYCTHGEDPPPPPENQPPIAAASASAVQAKALCIDDGVSGPRVQLVYVYRNDRPDRLGELLPTFRRLAAEMDGIFDQSAHKTGGSLRLRFVTDAGCKVDVAELVAAPRSIQGFGSLVQKMAEAGYNRLDRKYLMLVDDSVFCGVGTFNGGDHADAPDTLAHNFTGYARVDSPCWDAGTMAHELSHTLGAVQYSAPHTSRGAHCIDEWDVMCYSDSPYYPRMLFLCEDSPGEFRLDCHDDDYFAAQPAAGSYLSRHWNLANSPYLTAGREPTCVDAAFEPDDAYWYEYWKAPMRTFPVGGLEQHAFCEEPGDTDWAYFEARGGTTYRIETSNLAAGVDTQLVLYRGFEEHGWEGMTEIAANDDRGPGDASSAITFTAPSDGSFLVGVAEAGGRAGFDKTYALSIQEMGAGGSYPMSLSRTTAKPGAAFSVTVSNLTPGATASFWWTRDEEDSQLGSATAGGDGVATATFKVPRTARRGDYQVEMTATDGAAATATLRVVGDDDDKRAKSGKHGKAKKHKHKKHGHGGRRHG